MSLLDNDIQLSPIHQGHNIQHIWDECSNYCVEAILANRAGVYDFVEQDCMYFAVIQQFKTIRVPRQQRSLNWTSADPWSSAKRRDTYGYEYKNVVEPIGIIYLTSAPPPSCVNLGVCILPGYRGRGFGTRAVRLLLRWVFEEIKCHRIQMHLADGDASRRSRAVGMLTSVGFSYEGTSRLSLFCPAQSAEERSVGAGGEWRDMSTYAMLETDWIIHKNFSIVPPAIMKTRRQEMNKRHEQERLDLLACEARQQQRAREAKPKLKRISSTETVKDVVANTPEKKHDGLGVKQEVEEPSEFASSGDVDRHSQEELEIYELQSMIDDLLYGPPAGVNQESADESLYAYYDRTPAESDDIEGDSESLTFTASSRTRLLSASPTLSFGSGGGSVYHSPTASPLLPRPGLARSSSDPESDWEVESIPRSASVLSSNGSDSSWELWEERWETSSNRSDSYRPLPE